MQLAGLHRRPPARAPGFVNHTPKEFEITTCSPSQSPETAEGSSMAFGAGSPYTNFAMGQGGSVVGQDNIRKASSSILREDSIQIEEEFSNASRPDSWSLHCDRTDQAPYFHDSHKDSRMNTSLSINRLPKDNASHDLAFFLRTTGPSAPHRRPSKAEHPGRAAAPKNAFRFLKRQKRSGASPPATYDRFVVPRETITQKPILTCIDTMVYSVTKEACSTKSRKASSSVRLPQVCAVFFEF